MPYRPSEQVHGLLCGASTTYGILRSRSFASLATCAGRSCRRCMRSLVAALILAGFGLSFAGNALYIADRALRGEPAPLDDPGDEWSAERWGYPVYASPTEGLLIATSQLTGGILLLWWVVDLLRGKSAAR